MIGQAMTKILVLIVVLAAISVPDVLGFAVNTHAFSTPTAVLTAEGSVATHVSRTAIYSTSKCDLEDDHITYVNSNIEERNNEGINGRRRFLTNVVMSAVIGGGAFLSSTSIGPPAPAYAASMSQEDIDKQNVVKGYKRLQYLLNNWEKETTVCGMGGDNLERRCDRTPLKVMDYLGYKATTDPLYKGEKTLRRLSALSPPDKDAEFFEAVEAFAENADEASGMAFISSWGEANPGGGKDRVELFIERARRNVVVASNSLETVIKILDLPL